IQIWSAIQLRSFVESTIGSDATFHAKPSCTCASIWRPILLPGNGRHSYTLAAFDMDPVNLSERLVSPALALTFNGYCATGDDSFASLARFRRFVGQKYLKIRVHRNLAFWPAATLAKLLY